MNSPQEKSFKNFSKHVFGKLLLNKFFSRNTPNTFCEEKKNECWLIWVDPVDSIKKMEVKQKGSEQKDFCAAYCHIVLVPIVIWGLNIKFCIFNFITCFTGFCLCLWVLFLLKCLLIYVHSKYYNEQFFCEQLGRFTHRHSLCGTLN